MSKYKKFVADGKLRTAETLVDKEDLITEQAKARFHAALRDYDPKNICYSCGGTLVERTPKEYFEIINVSGIRKVTYPHFEIACNGCGQKFLMEVKDESGKGDSGQRGRAAGGSSGGFVISAERTLTDELRDSGPEATDADTEVSPEED